jgi:hypothetical protein
VPSAYMDCLQDLFPDSAISSTNHVYIGEHERRLLAKSKKFVVTYKYRRQGDPFYKQNPRLQEASEIYKVYLKP